MSYEIDCADFKKKYEPGHIICDGGIDTAYEDGMGGSRRPPCPARDECREGTAQRRRLWGQPASDLIPTTNLTRRFGPPPLLGSTPPGPSRWVIGRSTPSAPVTPSTPQWRSTASASSSPSTSYSPSSPSQTPPLRTASSFFTRTEAAYYVPPYVTVPEESGSLITDFLSSIMRAGAKGVFHQLAHMFDVTPVSKKKH